MKILWLSKHNPLQSQRQALVKLFGGGVEITIDSNPFASAKVIAQRMSLGKFDDMVLVAPLSVCSELTKLGIKPLWAEMRTVDCNSVEVEVEANGNREKLSGTRRCYKFIRFRRLIGVNLEFEDFTS